MPQLNAGATLEVTAYDRANLRQLAVGKVSAVDSQIDTTTGTVRVRAQFDNADNALFPNQFVNARLLIKTLHDAVTVPTSAILRGSPGAYVYVINADNTVSVRQIKTSAVDGNLTAVTSGLAGRRTCRDRRHRSLARRGCMSASPPKPARPLRPPERRPKAGGEGQHSGRRQNAPPSGGQ